MSGKSDELPRVQFSGDESWSPKRRYGSVVAPKLLAIPVWVRVSWLKTRFDPSTLR